MLKIQALFASAAVAALLLGLVIGDAERFGMSLTFRRTGYLIHPSTLCFGVALCFCVFACRYSLWMVPWSMHAAVWHFALSVLLAAVFALASFAAVQLRIFETSSRAALPVLLLWTLSPVLFLLLQSVFLLDSIRRALPGLRT